MTHRYWIRRRDISCNKGAYGGYITVPVHTTCSNLQHAVIWNLRGKTRTNICKSANIQLIGPWEMWIRFQIGNLQNTFEQLISCEIAIRWIYETSLKTSQHWFWWLFGVVTWTSVDQILVNHMVSPGVNGLRIFGTEATIKMHDAKCYARDFLYFSKTGTCVIAVNDLLGSSWIELSWNTTLSMPPWTRISRDW